MYARPQCVDNHRTPALQVRSAHEESLRRPRAGASRMMQRLLKRLGGWLLSDQVPVALSIVLTTAAGLSLVPDKLPFLYELQQRIEALAFDARMRWTLHEQDVDPMVVIVDIDEKSLAAEGQWPWP